MKKKKSVKIHEKLTCRWIYSDLGLINEMLNQWYDLKHDYLVREAFFVLYCC